MSSIDNCACSRYRTESGKTTGCSSTTRGRFAPGHDAKLKSFLIAAGADGEQVTFNDQRPASAIEYAEAAGYGPQVANGIDKEVARRTARQLTDMGPARDLLIKAARESDEQYRNAERQKVLDREDSAEW